MIDVRSLTGLSFDTLAAAMNDAFSDYMVPMSMTAPQLENMQRRRGYIAEASLGAFDGDRLVGFVFTCIDPFENGIRAYNSGTGVSPSHRRSGIARDLMRRAIDLVRARGASEYVLEVIESNERAAALYRAVGFETTRKLQCWTFAATEKGNAKELANADLDAIVANADVEPAWQNSLISIRRAPEPYVVLGDERGAAIVLPQS